MEEGVEILSESEVVGYFKEMSFLEKMHIGTHRICDSMYNTLQTQARQIPSLNLLEPVGTKTHP